MLYRAMVLPSLTIGSREQKTAGDYMATQRHSHREAPEHLVPDTSDRPGVPDWEFRLVLSPRKFFYRKPGPRDEKMETIRNYDSLSLSDLKYCLRVNQDADYEEDPEDLLVRYLREFTIGPGKFSSKNKHNPYNRMVRSSTARSSITRSRAALRSATGGSQSVDSARRSALKTPHTPAPVIPVQTPVPHNTADTGLSVVAESASMRDADRASVTKSERSAILKHTSMRQPALVIKQIPVPSQATSQPQIPDIRLESVEGHCDAERQDEHVPGNTSPTIVIPSS